MGTEAAARPERPPAPAPRAEPPSAPARARRIALAAIVLVGLAFASLMQNWSDNQSSHYDLIRALDAGRTTIDRGPYPTKDRARYKGHWYSARAPGLAMYSLPFYKVLNAVDAPAVARSSPALRGEDEMIDFVGLWGTVLPGLVLMLLVWRVGERFEPGYGVAGAVALGLGTLVLPFSTMLFSHVFAATLKDHNANVYQYQVLYFRAQRAARASGGEGRTGGGSKGSPEAPRRR